jgi:hypothetical protein
MSAPQSGTESRALESFIRWLHSSVNDCFAEYSALTPVGLTRAVMPFQDAEWLVEGG